MASMPLDTVEQSTVEKVLQREVKWDSRKCLCGQSNTCSELVRLLAKLAPTQHPWVGSIEFHRNTASENQNIFFECLSKHLKPQIDIHQNKRKYFVAKHHFSKELLQHRESTNQNFTTPIQGGVAKELDNRSGKNRCLYDNINRRFLLLKKAQKRHGLPPPKKKRKEDDNLYIRAPTNPIVDVKSYLISLCSGHSDRTVELTEIEKLEENFSKHF